MRQAIRFYRQRSEAPVDPLSDLVALLRPHDCVAAGLDAGGDWSVRFERHAGLKCNAVVDGACWLAVENEGPIRLDAGDCAILPHGRPFLLSSHPARTGRDADAVYAPARHGGTATYGGGGAFFMVGSRFLLSGPGADMILRTLPAVMVVRAGPDGAAVRWALRRMAEELRDPRPGGRLSIAHLAHFIFVQTMRCHLERQRPEPGGRLAAMADPRIAPAVAAMHDAPARAWTVEALARRVGMSRTSFAARFRHIAGETPMGYLTRWRMLLAADRLRHTQMPVARIAAEVGYGSESAFAAAFKRETGQTPRGYARGKDAATSS